MNNCSTQYDLYLKCIKKYDEFNEKHNSGSGGNYMYFTIPHIKRAADYCFGEAVELKYCIKYSVDKK